MTELKEEAEAFDRRISERADHGFVADLRKLQPNDYFYKSFWRHPHYADLYVGEMCRNYLHFMNVFLPSGGRVLDLGCGPGYFGLELARHGYQVVGMDISEKSIAKGREALARNDVTEGFGSLEYHVGSYSEAPDLGPFDAVLSSGFLHHIPELSAAVSAIHASLRPGGILIWHEPQHRRWTQSDAAFAGLVRLLLAQAGLWYEPELTEVRDKAALNGLTAAIHEEFVLERDRDEKGGQSPNDLSCDREEIVTEVERQFDLILTRPSFSFIYRMLGGMRGNQDKLNELASLLALVDKTYVENGILNANYFYGVARKT